jgi:predicted metal-binding membrane protein
VGVERGDGQSSYGQCGEECLLHCRYPLLFLISKTRPDFRALTSIYVSVQGLDCLYFQTALKFLFLKGHCVAAVMQTQRCGEDVDAVKARCC